MTESALVAAENLKDEATPVEAPKKDEATASDNGEQKKEEPKEEQKPKAAIEVVTKEDGDLFLKVESSASSLAATVLSVVALSSIIY